MKLRSVEGLRAIRSTGRMSLATQSGQTVRSGRGCRCVVRRTGFSVELFTAVFRQGEGGVPEGHTCRHVGGLPANGLPMEEGLGRDATEGGPGELLLRYGRDTDRERFCRVYVEEGLALDRKRLWQHATAGHRVEPRPGTRSGVWNVSRIERPTGGGFWH